LSRPAPRVVTAQFLTIGLLWSAGLFLADPALRMAIHAIAPDAADTLAARTAVPQFSDSRLVQAFVAAVGFWGGTPGIYGAVVRLGLRRVDNAGSNDGAEL